MSNEQKWTSIRGEIYTPESVYYGTICNGMNHPQYEKSAELCDKLNRINALESEVERLKGELEKTNQDRLEWMDEYNSLNATIEALQSDLDRCKSEYSDRVKLYDQSIKNLIEASKQEIARCKSERLAAEEILNELIERSGMFAPYPFNVIIDKAIDFLASQQTQEGKG